MDPVGTLLSIAHVLNRANTLYTSCKAAPEEIRLAADHIHTLALVLEGVKADLAKNRHSFVYQNTHIATTRIQDLKQHIGHCDASLKRMEALVNKYMGWKKNGGVGLWERYKWSTEGKKEIAECKADLVLCTNMLDMFLSKVGLNVLWKIESMMEVVMKRFDALELVQSHAQAQQTETMRPRNGSNVGHLLVVSLIISRMRMVLTRYRRRKMGKKPGPTKPTNTGPGPRRPKPVTRVSSGFAPSQVRNKMLESYASTIANASITTPKKPQRARTPSPDFYFDRGSTKANMDVFPKPVRRSSSMQRLLGTINAQTQNRKPQTEHYECWRVGSGKVAFGAKLPMQYVSHKRGQMQLRKMAAVFKEASQFDARALNEQDARVKAILKEKNGRERNKGTHRKWYLVAGRVIKRDCGRSGMVSVDRAMVILVRR
ncbi:hypothetical protein K505DRAFT_361296 [Melanomma pulvis-pyrius CBS 109.77]|uniref:Fungal N-terminal domain-containing protein n=1 Tax=Melanomma pulvis-pyrius CBS 109.77 TaxID=1314802 RepID=A0A6A6XDT3_9PLEO|nr:hypothetical protein K505DRAFT_361296 [Melanomma pulvis-pyrius CBS 109.77]